MSDEPMPATAADGIEPVTFDVRVTLEDMLALQLRCLQAPVLRAGRLKRQVIIVVVAAALAPLPLAAGVLIAWAGDRHALPLGRLLRSLVVDDTWTLVAAALVMAVCTGGGMLIQQWTLRPRMRRLLRRLLRTRPDVDPADPQLSFAARVSANGEGLESRNAVGTTLLRWGVLTSWEEADGRLTVLGNGMIGFCLGTATVEPAALDRLRATLTAQLGPRTSPRPT